MPLSGYKVEGLLSEFRRRRGYQQTAAYSAESLQISAEARQQAQRFQGYAERPKPPIYWLTPQTVIQVLADRTPYEPLVEYEQQRRAGLFLDPPYFPASPARPIELVHDYRSSQIQPEVKETRTFSSEASVADSPLPATISLNAPAPSVAAPSVTSPSKHVTLPVVLDEEDDLLEDSEREAQNTNEEESHVVYGTGRITSEATLEFIQRYPDSAIKFLVGRELDGKLLSPGVQDMYQTWQKRGLSRKAVKQYILQLMDWQDLPALAPHELWEQLRDKIYDLTHF